MPLMSVARNLYLGREPRRFGLIDVRAMQREAPRRPSSATACAST